jgi:predicted RNA-binding Zn-ribbon protein involved in translation (DUF1610 family)
MTGGGLLLGFILVVAGSIKRQGIWGINFKESKCPNCGQSLPFFRKPANRRQALYGGSTCQHCGIESDKWGNQVKNEDDPHRA